jgi:Flp pilus assembly protein TadG
MEMAFASGARTHCMSVEASMRHKREAGQALAFAILAIFVLLGFAGLAVDMGILRYDKRLQQTAADAAAIAGASNLAYQGGAGVTAGAQEASATNGFTNGTNHVTVTVNTPPTVGPHAGVAGYVEVYVTAVQPTYFMKALGINNETITARAVATALGGGANGGGCLYTLGAPSVSPEGINPGSASLSAPTCGIADNGDYIAPAGGGVTTETLAVSGTGSSGGTTCTLTPTACPTLGAPAAADPLSYLTPPGVGAPTAFNCNGGNAFPGTYGGITLTGNSSCNFAAGIYVLSGGSFTCQGPGTPTITGIGVMFYFTNGATWNCAGNDNISLTAPSATNCPACATQYDGILMFQDPSDTSGASIGGSVGSAYVGALYFPKAEVTFFGNGPFGSTVNVGIVVAEALATNGNPTVNLKGSAGLPTGVSLIKNAILVE